MAGEKKGFLDCLEIQKKVKNKEMILIPTAAKGLSGEESTIFAANAKKIKIVLMDDYAGIRNASLHGLSPYSCPYLLLKALKEKQISKAEFDELLEKLLACNYFISPKLLKKIIEISEKY